MILNPQRYPRGADDPKNMDSENQKNTLKLTFEVTCKTLLLTHESVRWNREVWSRPPGYSQ